ncbi:MAG TPA: restriction endonuclease [Candidatus Nanoarchaeia archaeon]|nr:restriction endonuclease [Candidatus Nanoarchaeia archaeon]
MGEEQVITVGECELCQQPMPVPDEKAIAELLKFIDKTGLEIHPTCFTKYVQEVTIGELGTKHLKKPLSFTGIVVYKSPKKFLTTSITYGCPSCGNKHTLRQKDAYVSEPTRCSCGMKNFRVLDEIMEEVVDITLQSDGHTIEAKPVINEQTVNIASGDKIKVFGVLHFEHKEARGRILNELKTTIRPLSVELVEKGKNVTPEEHLKKINGFEFEQLIGKMLITKGCQAVLTPKTGDGGTDLYAVINGQNTIVQCKHHLDKSIGRPDVDKLLGVMTKNQAKKGLFVCTGTYSPQSIELANAHNIELWDKDRVLKEMFDLKDFAEETSFANLSGTALKTKLDELFTRFIKRHNEVTATGNTVHIDMVKPLFSPSEWNILLTLLKKEGYDISYDDTIHKYERETTFDINRIATDMPASTRNKLITMKEIIQHLETQIGKTIPLEDIIKAAAEKDITDKEAEELLQKLKRAGDIFEPEKYSISRI